MEQYQFIREWIRVKYIQRNQWHLIKPTIPTIPTILMILDPEVMGVR